MLSFYRLLMNESAPIRFVLIPLPATLYRIVVIHTIPYIQHFKISLANPLPGWFCWRPVLTVANRKIVSLFQVVLQLKGLMLLLFLCAVQITSP
jgi:hypothetical protein